MNKLKWTKNGYRCPASVYHYQAPHVVQPNYKQLQHQSKRRLTYFMPVLWRAYTSQNVNKVNGKHTHARTQGTVSHNIIQMTKLIQAIGHMDTRVIAIVIAKLRRLTTLSQHVHHTFVLLADSMKRQCTHTHTHTHTLNSLTHSPKPFLPSAAIT